MTTPANALTLLKEKEAKFVDLRFTDTRGKEQHLTIPAHVVDASFFEDGKMFDGSSIAGWKGIQESDMVLMPDASTIVIDPFMEDTTATIRCDVYEPSTMQGYNRCPRMTAKRAEAYLKSTGIADQAFFGPENEFFIFDDVRYGADTSGAFYQIDSDEGAWNSKKEYENGNTGHRPGIKGGYFPVPPVDALHDIRSQMCLTLEEMGLGVEVHHLYGVYVQKLARFGITVTAEQIVTSSDAAANHLRSLFSPGTPIYVVGEWGLQQAVTAQGFTVITESDYTRLNGNIPAVIVGLTRQVTYNELACATLLIHRGATFIGTNPDVTYPSEYGNLPGAGAVVAFVAAATGVQPTLIGKPGPILFQEALRRLNADPTTTAMVGDRLETDIAGAQALGLKTILVLSGISGRDDITRTGIRPDFIFADITALAHYLAVSY